MEDGTVLRQSARVAKDNDQFQHGKMPVDSDVPYDPNAIRDQYPALSDFERPINEESVIQIAGVRSLSERGNFLDTMQSPGLDRWSELQTERYRQYHP